MKGVPTERPFYFTQTTSSVGCELIATYPVGDWSLNTVSQSRTNLFSIYKRIEIVKIFLLRHKTSRLRDGEQKNVDHIGHKWDKWIASWCSSCYCNSLRSEDLFISEKLTPINKWCVWERRVKICDSVMFIRLWLVITGGQLNFLVNQRSGQ